MKSLLHDRNASLTKVEIGSAQRILITSNNPPQSSIALFNIIRFLQLSILHYRKEVIRGHLLEELLTSVDVTNFIQLPHFGCDSHFVGMVLRYALPRCITVFAQVFTIAAHGHVAFIRVNLAFVLGTVELFFLRRELAVLEVVLPWQ